MTSTGPFWRSAFSLRMLLTVVPLVSLLVLVIFLLPRLRPSALQEAPLTCVVRRMPYVHDVLVTGELESSSNVEVKCEVEARGFSQAKILQIVPEGNHVEKGDFLVQLDASKLEDMCVRQQIICNTYQARVVEAKADFETAKISLEQYVKATYLEGRKKLQSKIFVAEEGVRLAERNIEYSKKLLAKGYITELQVQADEFAMEKAKKELQAVRTAMNVLNNYTRVKLENLLKARITTAEADVKSREHSHRLALRELEHLREQVKKCEIRSPCAGSVVYVHLNHGDHMHMIEEGANVREHQVMIRLPDPTKMRIKCKVPEDRVTAIKPGLPVRVRFDAFDDLEVLGKVKRVSEFPNREYWRTTKEYETLISLDAESVKSQSADLKSGMTADARICLERLEDESQLPLLVPLQAVIEHGSKHYCLTYDSGNFVTHEVETGEENGKRMIITGGLEEGQEIVLGAGVYLEQAELPELPPEVEEEPLDIGPPPREPRGSETASRGVPAG